MPGNRTPEERSHRRQRVCEGPGDLAEQVSRAAQAVDEAAGRDSLAVAEGREAQAILIDLRGLQQDDPHHRLPSLRGLQLEVEPGLAALHCLTSRSPRFVPASLRGREETRRSFARPTPATSNGETA